MPSSPSLSAPTLRPRASTNAQRLRGTLAALAGVAREHAAFVALLAAGAALRGITLFAYRPALIYFDSVSYLQNAIHVSPHQGRPIGYSLLLRMLSGPGLWVVPLVQHLLALAVAVLLYTLLLRLGVRRWLAALATAPLLLDAYQLKIEQFVLSETLLDALVVGACAVLLWRRPLSLRAAALAGLLLAGAALTHANALILVVPAALAVLFLRAGPARAGALVAAFVVPLLAYAAWFHHYSGAYSITGFGGRFLYARVSSFVDCSKFSVPSRERVLCPQQPIGQRPSIETFLRSPRYSPVYRLRGDDMYRDRIAGEFARRAILHQPLDYLRVVFHDTAHAFMPTRTRWHGERPIARWKFQPYYPIYTSQTASVLRRHGGGRPRVDKGLARFLTGYQVAAFTPGPVFAASLIVALLAALGLGRARRSGLRSAAFLFAAMGALLLLATVAANQFTWRYVLPELVLLPPAGALGLTALLRAPSQPAREGSSIRP